MKILICILVSVLAALSVCGQESEKTGASTDVDQLIKDQRFQFFARSADPLRGRTIFLTAGYTFTVLPDSVISDLPFYGRAYQAPMNPSEGGFKFTSTDFSYAVKERKRGGRDILIKTNDVKNSPQMSLFVGKDSNATLRITSVDRASISYSGYIRKPSNN